MHSLGPFQKCIWYNNSQTLTYSRHTLSMGLQWMQPGLRSGNLIIINIFIYYTHQLNPWIYTKKATVNAPATAHPIPAWACPKYPSLAIILKIMLHVLHTKATVSISLLLGYSGFFISLFSIPPYPSCPSYKVAKRTQLRQCRSTNLHSITKALSDYIKIAILACYMFTLLFLLVTLQTTLCGGKQSKLSYVANCFFSSSVKLWLTYALSNSRPL